MVVSKRPEMLRTAATWIKRLDQADTERTSVHVYQVKYGDARQIARVLTDMFIGGSGSSLLDSAADQVAPGSRRLLVFERRPPVVERQCFIRRRTASEIPAEQPREQEQGPEPHRALARSPAVRTEVWAAAEAQTEPMRLTAAAARPPATASRYCRGDVRITPDTVNNSLLIYADQANYRIIEATLLQVDKPQIQVAIDRDDRRGDAHKRPELWRANLPDQPQCRTKAEHGLHPQHPGDDRAPPPPPIQRREPRPWRDR